MKHPLSIWGLYFSVPLCSDKRWIAWSTGSGTWRSSTLSSPCFQCQVLVTSGQGLLAPKDHLYGMSWVVSGQSPYKKCLYLIFDASCKPHQHFSIFFCEAKNLPRYDKVFSTYFQISFETRQHMEASLVAAASACSVNSCQLTGIACLSLALKFT